MDIIEKWFVIIISLIVVGAILFAVITYIVMHI